MLDAPRREHAAAALTQLLDRRELERAGAVLAGRQKRGA
jgi:hypothetical protein